MAATTNRAVDIYSYGNAPSFLRDAWAMKKSKNPAFSMRAWAKKMGMRNNSALSLMLAEKRPVPRKYVPQFIQTLDLDSKSGLYLETLIDLTNAKTPYQQEFYLQRLKSIRPTREVHFSEIESFQTIRNPLHSIILEMTDLKDFDSEPQKIKARLLFEASTSEIKQAIKRLLTLRLLHKTKEGKLAKTHQHLSSTPDVRDLGSQEYHKKVSLLAHDSISEQSLQEREFNGYAFNVSKSDLPKAKQLIRTFIQSFVGEIEAKGPDAEETYQLNVQLFMVTKNKGEKNEPSQNN